MPFTSSSNKALLTVTGSDSISGFLIIGVSTSSLFEQEKMISKKDKIGNIETFIRL
jgi:hypothetical protein